MGGERWKIVGMYMNGHIEENSGEIRDLTEEN